MMGAAGVAIAVALAFFLFAGTFTVFHPDRSFLLIIHQKGVRTDRCELLFRYSGYGIPYEIFCRISG